MCKHKEAFLSLKYLRDNPDNCGVYEKALDGILSERLKGANFQGLIAKL